MAQDTNMNLVEKKLNSLEVMKNNNEKITSKNINELKHIYDNLVKNNANINEEDKLNLEDRINEFINMIKEETNTLGVVSPKSTKASKKLMFRKALAGVTLSTVVIAGVTGLTLYGCSDNNEITAEVNEDANEEKVVVIKDAVNTEVVKNDSMSEETKAYCDKIADAINDAVSKGFEIKEENKEAYAKKFINYANIINMDKLTDVQWATYYQDGNIVGKDMMNDLWNIETVFEKIVTVSMQESEAIDFSKWFNETDAKMLNEANRKIVKINNSTGSERKQAINEMHDYVINVLINTETRMQYSEVALNTFRGVYVNAFDVLSEYNSLTDEEEHAIFTVFANCNNINEANLNVKDKTISTLQSKFELYMVEKADKRLENKVNVALNKYDSMDEMAKYVASRINLSLYREHRDYEEFQKSFMLKGGVTSGKKTVKAANASIVSDGKGGNISKSQLASFGISENDPAAKAKLEAAVQAKYNAEAEKTKVTKDMTGQVVDPALAAKYAQQGAEDCNRGVNNCSSVPVLYQPSYMEGWNRANEAKQNAINSSKGSTTSYETVNNGSVVERTETTVEIPYTGPISQPQPVETVQSEPVQSNPPSEPITEFVPIESGSSVETPSVETTTVENSTVERTEEVVVYDYVSKSGLNKSLAKLNSIREYLSHINELDLYKDGTKFVADEGKTMKM